MTKTIALLKCVRNNIHSNENKIAQSTHVLQLLPCHKIKIICFLNSYFRIPLKLDDFISRQRLLLHFVRPVDRSFFPFFPCALILLHKNIFFFHIARHSTLFKCMYVYTSFVKPTIAVIIAVTVVIYNSCSTNVA